MPDVCVMQITKTGKSVEAWASYANLRHCKRQETGKPEMHFGL
jgi:hypothetical protein